MPDASFDKILVAIGLEMKQETEIKEIQRVLRKERKELFKAHRGFDALRTAVLKFHQERVSEHGEPFLKRNIDIYGRLLIKYSLLYRRYFCEDIVTHQIAALVASILNELNSD